jgi:hypothetical protein
LMAYFLVLVTMMVAAECRLEGGLPTAVFRSWLGAPLLHSTWPTSTKA